MADEGHVVRGISWSEVFSFTHIFKTFKMAIHPAKIVLVLLALVLVYCVGRAMDKVWSAASDSNLVMRSEAWQHYTALSRADLKERKELWAKLDRPNSLGALLGRYPDITKEPAKMAKEEFSTAVKALRDRLAKDYRDALEKIDARHKDALKAADAKTGKEKEEAREQARLARTREERAAFANLVAQSKTLDDISGSGIFAGLLAWESQCVSNALTAVRGGNFFGGLTLLMNERGTLIPAPYRAKSMANLPPPQLEPVGAPEGLGLVGWMLMLGWGVWWFVSIYPFYALIFIVLLLAIWAVLGGATCRIAALHAAREEKITMAAAVKFSLAKFVSFASSPVLPIVIICFLGGILFLAGLVGSLGFVGEWFVAIFFLLALVLGAVIAFLGIGLGAGWPLMWPTIAVEGSDSFDAISRSFSYVFQRPFRYGMYWLVAIVYGTACYFFVRLFAFITLCATHWWMSWSMGISRAAREHYGAGAGKLDVMWAPPTFADFHGPMQWEAMDGSEKGAAVLIALWVYLVSGVVAAFLISFFLSSATSIYYLMRKKIDATDLDDVYVEEPQEPSAPAGEAATTTEQASSTTTVEATTTTPAPTPEAPAQPEPPQEGGPTPTA